MSNLRVPLSRALFPACGGGEETLVIPGPSAARSPESIITAGSVVASAPKPRGPWLWIPGSRPSARCTRVFDALWARPGMTRKQSCSRDAHFASEFCGTLTERAAQKSREAERRKAHVQGPPAAPLPPQRIREGAARADRRALAFRRPTADSLRRINASAQLRPRFLGDLAL
jgi:hypothetical protein